MRVEFTGAFEQLEAFADKIEKMPDALALVSEQLAEETIELIREGFETSTDPRGHRWRPLVLRDGRPLEDSGGLKASWHRRAATREGFSVASAKRYAIYHQRGTGIYGPRKQPIKPVHAKALRLPGGIFRSSVKGAPQRKMVPGRNPLPEKWRKRYVSTAQEVLTEIFR